MGRRFDAEVKIYDPCFWKRIETFRHSMETCPCSSQRILRRGVVGLPAKLSGKLEAVRVKAVVVASLNVGTGSVPVSPAIDMRRLL